MWAMTQEKSLNKLRRRASHSRITSQRREVSLEGLLVIVRKIAQKQEKWSH